MHAEKVSHKMLDNACAWMHAARRNALHVNVLSAIESRRLTVTGLGRGINSAKLKGAEPLNAFKVCDRESARGQVFNCESIIQDPVDFMR